MILETPGQAPFPVSEFLKSSPSETVARSLKCAAAATSKPCEVPIRIGFFFDGTNNNIYRDRDGLRIEVDSMGKPIPSTPSTIKRLSDTERSHSNVAKLFQAYPETNPETGIFSYYTPGVGTPFPSIGEETETSDGKAFATGGQARIIFSLLQIVNSIHFTVSGSAMYNDKEVGKHATSYDFDNHTVVGESEMPRTMAQRHLDFFDIHLQKLSNIRAANPKPVIPSVTLDVFGFSRGAAEAVAFCHLFDDLLVGGRFASVPSKINFLGVFDVVASVGISASVAMTTPMPEAVASGHGAWAARILNPLPSVVRSGRHFIAAHEQRMNFPVTTLTGPEAWKEYFFPGVHSDVGGGYGPGEGGKSYGSQMDLLSQIPLLYMFKAAREESVPFRLLSDLDAAVQGDFEVSSDLAAAWSAYTHSLTSEETKKGHGDMLKRHMSLFYYWRALRLKDYEDADFVAKASAQARQDLVDSNRLLRGDLVVMRMRARGANIGEYQKYEKDRERFANQWIWERRNEELDEWEQFALDCFDSAKPLSPIVVRFFDYYVHDSFAGFYLAGEVTEFDKRVKIAKVMKKNPDDLRGFDKKIHALTSSVQSAKQKRDSGLTLTPAEEAILLEAENGTPYPIMTDEDTVDMRNRLIKSQTWTRREGGGYLLRRGYYPKKGFLRKKKTVIESELMRSAKSDKANDARRSGEFALVWSENILADVGNGAKIVSV